MEDKSSATGGGIGICTVLFIVFLILKLTGVITWSWVWICAPLWIPVALVLVIMLITIIVVSIVER